MLSCHGIGHCKLTVTVILNEGVKTARMHFGLQNHLAILDIFGIYSHDTDNLLGGDAGLANDGGNDRIERVKIILRVLQCKIGGEAPRPLLSR